MNENEEYQKIYDKVYDKKRKELLRKKAEQQAKDDAMKKDETIFSKIYKFLERISK